MTYINSWRKMGREEGRKEGMQEMLIGLIREKFDQVPDWVTNKLAQANATTLLDWGRALIKTNKHRRCVRLIALAQAANRVTLSTSGTWQVARVHPRGSLSA